MTVPANYGTEYSNNVIVYDIDNIHVVHKASYAS